MVAGGILQAFVLVPLIRFFGDGLANAALSGVDADRLDGLRVRSSRLRALHRRRCGGRRRHHQPLPRVAADRFVDCLRVARHGRGTHGAAATALAAPIATCRWRPFSSALCCWSLRSGSFWELDPQAGGGLSLRCSISRWINLAAAILIVLFGFLFVTVSSRLTGEIGSSSNPISGMTIATLLLTCLIFLMLGLDGGALPPAGAFRRGGGVHRVVERRHDVAGPQDRFSRRRDAQVATVGHRRRLGFIVASDRRGSAGDEPIEHDLLNEESAAAKAAARYGPTQSRGEASQGPGR